MAEKPRREKARTNFRLLKVFFWLLVALQLALLAQAAFWDAAPLRWELHLTGFGQSVTTGCAPQVYDCAIEQAILGAGCVLIPTDNHDTGLWAIYWTPYDRLGDGHGGMTTDNYEEFGVGDCGTLLHHRFVAFADVFGQVVGGTGVPGATFQLEDQASGAELGVMAARFAEGCTYYTFFWFDYVDGYTLHYGVDDYGQAFSTPMC